MEQAIEYIISSYYRMIYENIFIFYDAIKTEWQGKHAAFLVNYNYWNWTINEIINATDLVWTN